MANADVLNTCIVLRQSYTPLKKHRPYDEVKKTKAIESKQYPQPSSIKQTLGKHLGDVVVGCIPADILKRLKSKSTAETRDNMEYMAEFITDVGDRIKEHVVIKMQVDSMEMEDQKKIDELIEALRNKVDGKAIEIRAIGEEICKKQMDAIMGRYQNKYIKIKDLIEKTILGSIKATEDVKREYSTIARNKLKSKEIRMRREFCYHMRLAHGELIEQFLDEKCANEVRREEELKALNENNIRKLECLRVRLEAEHVRNLAELENWYETQNSIRPVEVVGAAVEQAEQAEPDRDGDVELLYTKRLREIDDKSRENNNELFVYKHRLKYVLNGFVDFVRNTLQGRPTLLEEQLASAQLLMEKVNEIDTRSLAECESPAVRTDRNNVIENEVREIQTNCQIKKMLSTTGRR